MERLAGKEARNGESATVDLAAFHRQIDFLSALISGDDVELGPDRFIQEQHEGMGEAAGPGGAALRRVRSLSHVMDGFVGSIRAHIEQIIRPLEASQPGKLGPVELNLFSADQLIEIKCGQEDCES